MPDEPVTVGSFQFLPEAEAVRLHLAEEEIESFLVDAEAVQADWFLGNALGYIKVQVASRDAERARAIVEQCNAEQRAHADEELTDDPACLACGAAMAAGESKCSQCGWSYADDAAESDEVEDASSPPPVLASFRALKKPVLLAMFGPGLLMIALAFVVIVIAALLWLVRA